MLLLAACSSGGVADVPEGIPTLKVGDTRAAMFGYQFFEENGESTFAFTELESAEDFANFTIPTSRSLDATMSTAAIPSTLQIWLMDELDEAGEPGEPVVMDICEVAGPGDIPCTDLRTGEPSSLAVTVRGDGLDPVGVGIELPEDLDVRVVMIQSEWPAEGAPLRGTISWLFIVGDWP